MHKTALDFKIEEVIVLMIIAVSRTCARKLNVGFIPALEKILCGCAQVPGAAIFR